MTALHYGSWFNKENVVKVLLAANAYINPKNDVSRILCVYIPQVVLVFLDDVVVLGAIY